MRVGEDLPESDIDLMVSFERPVGIYRFMELQDRLKSATGRDIDLVSKNAVNKYLEPYSKKDIVTIFNGEGEMGSRVA